MISLLKEAIDKEKNVYSSIDKKKILLINPPSGFLLDERVFLPLGIASIASIARERGHIVKLLDLKSDSDYLGEVETELLSKKYDAIGITATSPQFYYAYQILHTIKKTRNTKTIIGGPHASMFSSLRKQLIKDNRTSDMDDDINFRRLEEFDNIANGEEESLEMAIISNEKWVDGGVSERLDGLPLPARDLFNFNDYLYDSQGLPKFKINNKPSGSLISQRGCPYQCEFCCGRDSKMYHAVKLSGGILRTHSPERILKELDEMNEMYGLESFMFYDDEFNLHQQRTIDLCKTLSQRNYSFRGFIKSDLLVKHPEIASWMRKAGFNEILTGIESGSERILRNHLHKKTSPELNYRAAEILLENGIDLKALTMLGHVSETPKDIMDTRDWLIKTGMLYRNKIGEGHFTFDLTVFQPYAGCPIWDRAQKNNGDFSEEYKWAYYSKEKDFGGIYFNKVDFSEEHGFYKGIPGKYRAFIRTKEVSAEQYVYLRDSIEWDLRDRLKMPQLIERNTKTQFEHSMGQGSIRAV